MSRLLALALLIPACDPWPCSPPTEGCSAFEDGGDTDGLDSLPDVDPGSDICDLVAQLTGGAEQCALVKGFHGDLLRGELPSVAGIEVELFKVESNGISYRAHWERGAGAYGQAHPIATTLRGTVNPLTPEQAVNYGPDHYHWLISVNGVCPDYLGAPMIPVARIGGSLAHVCATRHSEHDAPYVYDHFTADQGIMGEVVEDNAYGLIVDEDEDGLRMAGEWMFLMYGGVVYVEASGLDGGQPA